MPFHSVAQVEPVQRAIVLDIPRLGELRLGLEVVVEFDQPVVDQFRAGVGCPAGGDSGIEMLWVAVDGGDQYATADWLFVGWWRGLLISTVCARRQHQGGRADDHGESASDHGSPR